MYKNGRLSIGNPAAIEVVRNMNESEYKFAVVAKKEAKNVHDELKGAYNETQEAVRDVLQSSSRNSLPVGVITAAVDFESRMTTTVIREMIERGELTEYDDGKVSLM